MWAWGAGGTADRTWCGEADDLAARGAAVPDEVLTEVEAEVHPADPMMMVFSSGSTADPKAVIHTHGATVRHAHNLNQLRDLRADDVIYTPMPLFWVGGLSFSLVAAMHAGASLVFEERFEPGATLALLERERVTQVLGWPHMGKALADHPSWRERDLSSIRSGAATALPAPGDRQPRARGPRPSACRRRWGRTRSRRTCRSLPTRRAASAVPSRAWSIGWSIPRPSTTCHPDRSARSGCGATR